MLFAILLVAAILLSTGFSTEYCPIPRVQWPMQSVAIESTYHCPASPPESFRGTVLSTVIYFASPLEFHLLEIEFIRFAERISMYPPFQADFNRIPLRQTILLRFSDNRVRRRERPLSAAKVSLGFTKCIARIGGVRGVWQLISLAFAES